MDLEHLDSDSVWAAQMTEHPFCGDPCQVGNPRVQASPCGVRSASMHSTRTGSEYVGESKDLSRVKLVKTNNHKCCMKGQQEVQSNVAWQL